MKSDVKVFIASCQICQQMKDLHHHPAGLLQPLPIPELVFEDIAMDFITCLPSSKGKATILTVVDHLSKYGHFIPLPSPFTAESVVAMFVGKVIRLHGHLRTTVTDRDPRFIHSFWQEIHRLQGTTLAMSTAYHPQTDGQSEALNKCIELYLCCFVLDAPKNWVAMLPWAEFWYNTSLQSSAGMTPFEALYGRKPPSITRYVTGVSLSELVEQFLLQQDEVLDLLKGNLLKAQKRMKAPTDQHHSETTFQVGDWVYVKRRPFRQQSVRGHPHHKLGRKFFGPFQVLKKVETVAYKLELPDAARIHPVFHVSMLKRCVGQPDN